jgi:hypothetical protein
VQNEVAAEYASNDYLYAYNHPLTFVDPSGLIPNWLEVMGSIADEYGAGNFTAGMGDNTLTGVRFTDYSIMDGIGKLGGFDDSVNYCSEAYTVGEVTGAAVATTFGVGNCIQKGGWMNSNRYLRFDWSRKGGNRILRMTGDLLKGKNSTSSTAARYDERISGTMFTASSRFRGLCWQEH